MSETMGQRKLVGAVWFVVAIVSLVVSFGVQSFADWGGFGYLLAAAVALLGLVGLFMLLTGKGNLIGSRTSVKAQRTFAIVGVIAATVLVVGYLITDWDVWTAVDILSIGVWVSIGVMFAVTIAATNATSRQS